MTKSTEKAKAAAVKKAGKQKAEKIFHPESRKAGQMEREALRKVKLANKLTKRGKKQTAQADRFVFFWHAIPPDVQAFSLADLHELVKDEWLTRYDTPLEQEQAARRKGRPKSAREIQLEDAKRRDMEEYRTGLELPDFTDTYNLKLFRAWDGVDVNYLDILRFIRISAEFPETVHVARVGRKVPSGVEEKSIGTEDEGQMDVDGSVDASKP